MEIKLLDVEEVFRSLLEGRISREAADRWAYSVLQASEADSLIFVPAGEQEKIWRGVMYLYGIDTKDTPNSYLHSLEDIQRAFAEKLR